MTPKPYVRVIVNTLAFLELSDDSIIDPDSAVSQMERISAELQELSLEEKNEFLGVLKRMAETEAARNGPPRLVSFLNSLPDYLRL